MAKAKAHPVEQEEPKHPRRKRQQPARPGPVLAILTLLYALFLAGIALSNAVGPERWWLSSLNLYVPQWLWLLPCAFLMPWYLLRAWRWTWLPLLLFAWVAGPLMGLCWQWRRPPLAATQGVKLRVMTWNVKWGRVNPQAIKDEIARDKPDLIVMQDAGNVLQTTLSELKYTWNTRASDQYVIASRFPISEPAIVWVTPRQHRVLRATITVDGQTIVFYDVHLLSPRGGLSAVRHHRADGSEDMQENADNRLDQATRLAQQIETEQEPVFLGGDFNAPMPSLVCKRMASLGLQDAFAEAGRGYGYTYGQSTPIRTPYVRIDHIFVSKPWQVRACYVGTREGSQHSPVIADLFLPTP